MGELEDGTLGQWLSMHANSMRSSGRLFWEPDHLAQLISQAQNEGVQTSWRDATYLARRFDAFTVAVPEFVTEFVQQYVMPRHYERALDPSVSFGSAPLLLACASSFAAGVGLVRAAADLELIELFSRTPSVSWRAARTLDDLGPAGFDLVVSAPPFGARPVDRSYSPANQSVVQLHEAEGIALLVDAAARLEHGGELIAVVPGGFFLRRTRGALNALNSFGLSVNAAIAIPEGAFGATAIPIYLVFLSQTPSDGLFLGELQAAAGNSELLSNLQLRQPGAVPELGRMVNRETFQSWRGVVLTEQIAEITRGRELTAYRLADIGEIHRARAGAPDGGLIENENAVYVPLIGRGPAVTRLSDLEIKPQNYAQIVLRPEVAISEYVALFMNSEIGLRIRQSALSGFTIPKISAQTLADVTLYVPSLEIQREVAEAQRTIRELELSLAAHKRRLHDRPEDVANVREALGRLNQKESLKDWLDGLPFPIASILWRYVAAHDAHYKVQHLLHFFEGTAQFITCVMLSALHAEPAYFDAHRREWFPDPTGRDDLRRATFGTWVVIGSRLAASVRTLISIDETRANARAMFRVTRDELLIALSSKELFDVLDRARNYRNEWVGHGGVEGDRERQRRLAILEEELTRLRAIIAGAFEHCRLIQPKTARIVGGIHYYTATSLTGITPIFPEVEVRVTTGMEDGRSYLLDSQSLAPLELLPFVRMMASPTTEATACYFYNRLDHGSVRFVSYHFEHESERVEADPGLVTLLDQLRAQ